MVIRKLYVPPTVNKQIGQPTKLVGQSADQETAVAFSLPETNEEPTPIVFGQVNGEKDDVIVDISPGKIRGVKHILPNGQNFFSFSGVPYAKPPVGDLRFKPPVPVEKFDDDVLDCQREGNNCYSYLYFPPEAEKLASEDCLFLNVYTPKLPTKQDNEKLPVMVWIHGGGFNFESGDSSLYGPEFLLKEGVVVVTCNYRLGALGFLSLPSVGIHGNMGLKDQQLVLQWVNENIAGFGGDSNNVTLFGESAGGASVHLNYLNETSRQYFHKAICMSGVSYNPWVLESNPEVKARHLAKLLGADVTNDEDVYRTLMGAPPNELILQSTNILSEADKGTNKFFPFTPVVESTLSEKPFLTENLISLMMKPNMTNIPLITGLTSNEGLLVAGESLKDIELYEADATKLVPQELPLDGDRLKDAAFEIKRFFFGDDAITVERLSTLVDILSDNMFVMAAYVASELHARYQNEAPLYFYLDSFVGQLNKYRNVFAAPDHLEGVCHADELPYLFSSTWLGTDVEQGSREDNFRSTICKLWTNFAKHGNPTPTDGGIDFVWAPVKPVSDSQFVLDAAELNDELKMVQNPFGERVQFWRELFARYYDTYLHGSVVN
ncbi:esterase B1-like [Armigeres subalbatus]|uniref:esterase B1-like n=1 Tax=Armigeres subalbatus TaxID=124917 RepID=UPI002ED184E5